MMGLLLVCFMIRGSSSSSAGRISTVAGLPPLSSFAVVVCNATQNLPGCPSYQEEDAAQDVQNYLSLALGRNLTLHRSNASWCTKHTPSAASPVIAVGPAAAQWCGLPEGALEGLGQEGVLVTSASLAPGCIVATGAVGAPRGTLYAGTELLELLGFRFLHEEQTVIPSANVSVPTNLHRRYVPQLEYRAFDDFTATVRVYHTLPAIYRTHRTAWFHGGHVVGDA